MKGKILTPQEIAIKYVHGLHDALTDSQEINDMIEDIIRFSEDYSNEKKIQIAVKILAEIVEYAKFKSWGTKGGDEKAEQIASELHSGKYNRYEGMWVQADWAIKLLSKSVSKVKK